MKVDIRKVTLFIGITFSLTLTFHFIIAFTINPNKFLGFAMVIPFLAVVIIQKVMYRKKIIPTLGLSIGQFKWYIIAIIIPIFMSFNFNWTIEQFFKMLLIGLTVSTLSALLEEVSWRGFLWNELIPVSRLKAYIVTALIWSIWHIPVAVLYKYSDDIFLNTILYCGQLFLLSLIISWLRDKSNSVIPASLFHGMLNVFYF
ncbi:CAAX protease self-immunity [Virgibacillus subterraneus]|uniref:CAAX protease self-immunity n=1 Tax=Virgibacillus subterraneus TaxID=621109 RepID=A0A1H9L6S5_9BACI|nr:CPBP family intramembrane glutamic endopeptidase [Virgibacillus subterraneus]SER06865.1 CAAX protease self-immunity [Virgibacillus subterraneus]